GMQLLEHAPRGWDADLDSPLLTEGFAEAARGLGYRPRYVADPRDRALVLLRSVPVPVFDAWTRRARVYVNRGHQGFLADLFTALRGAGVSHAKLNDERHGLGHGYPAWPRLVVIPRWVFL